MRIALVHPEIPQNTGNVARTCAALGAQLDLVRPLGFDVSERAVRRAGLDYWDLLDVCVHDDVEAFLRSCSGAQVVLFTSKAAVPYTDVRYDQDVILVFGSETKGLPRSVVDDHDGPVARIPTVAAARCLNLSNAVAVAAYEVARQYSFSGLQKSRSESLQPEDVEGV
jgi:tRNA (cytidine/uridine-2'-O-)-methyltransferase